jgi:cytidylate kinase
MPTGLPASDPHLSKAVERQMRNWELSRSQHWDAFSRTAPPVKDFITISREVGSGGAAIARQLGERLGWPVFDKEILVAMADDDAVRTQLYQSMDERDLSWLEETLRSLADSDFRRNDYFRRLTETVLVLARQASAVFVGRGADMILPRDRGLRVGITASCKYRIQEFARRHGLMQEAAREEVLRLEEDRAAWIRNRFRVEATDWSRHDLVLNSERMATEHVISLILAARAMKIAQAAK